MTDFKLLVGCLSKKVGKRPYLTALLTKLSNPYWEAEGKSPPEIVDVKVFTAIGYNNRSVTYVNLKRHEAALANYNQALHATPNLMVPATTGEMSIMLLDN